MVVCLKIWQTTCLIENPFYLKKIVWFVCDHSNGARSGREIGMKSSIAVKNAPKRLKMAKESSAYIFHPYRVLLILLLFGISMIFLSLSFSLVYTRIQNDLDPIRLPFIFYFNTLLLLLTSYTLWRANQNYLTDDTESYIKSLIVTVIITLIFLISQIYGWGSMFNQNIFINSDNSAAYLYVISGLHFAHVLGGLPFLILFIIKAKRHMKEPVSVLVYFSDPEKRLKLKLLSLYWHYLDGLWIYLVLFFLINYIS